MRRRIITCTMAIAAMMAMPSRASAQLTTDTPVCTNGGALATLGATACRGSFVGNNKNQQAGVLAQLASFGGTWSLLGSSDDAGNGPFTSNPSGTTGTLTLDTRLSGPFALILKAANNFSIYYFANPGAGVTSLSYTTAGTALNPQGIPQGLSHATIWTQTVVGPPTAVVPEPSTYALLATGLIGLVTISRGRRRA